MNRITEVLSRRKGEGRKALSLFITAGLPRPDKTADSILAFADAGADLIELGIPFSDPIADGPIIQACSERSLKLGTTMKSVFNIVREVRQHSQIPLILMGYANPVYRMGLTRFLEHCAINQVDGTIIADIPLEESAQYAGEARRCGLAPVFLAAPTSPDERLRQLDEITGGFLYCVSVTGVTGTREHIAEEAGEFLGRARATITRNPLLAGFGISSPQAAVAMARHCDGVIIGSALMKFYLELDATAAVSRGVDFVRSVRTALDS